MSSPQAVLAHLLEGREELVREVQRLTTAISELDAVIGRVGGAGAVQGLPAPPPAPGTSTPEPTASRQDVETGSAAASRSRRSATGRAGRAKAAAKPAKSAARKSASRTRSRAAAGQSGGPGQKSIRVHVLEMLASEKRDFGLAEIIDRIHGQGIEAHDDAVRSITIKLMKDGRVERVGRGQYRLARRGSARADAPVEPARTAAGAAPGGAESRIDPSPAAASPAGDPAPAQAPAQSAPSMSDRPAAQAMGTPALNLAEPWRQ